MYGSENPEANMPMRPKLLKLQKSLGGFELPRASHRALSHSPLDLKG